MAALEAGGYQCQAYTSDYFEVNMAARTRIMTCKSRLSAPAPLVSPWLLSSPIDRIQPFRGLLRSSTTFV